MVAAVGLRVLLVYHSPRPDGYVYDFYFEAIEHVDTTGTLPVAADCWECYQPPLYYILGFIFYRAGWLLSHTRDGALHGLTALSLLSGCVTVWYSIQLLRLLRQRGAYLLLGGVVILVFPCLFIGSWGAEADSLQTALMSAFVYYLSRYDSGKPRHRVRLVAIIGVLTGLAIATKHNGLIALGVTGIVLTLRMLTGPQRRNTIRDGLIILVIAAAIGSWKYVDNINRYGRPFHANVVTPGFHFGSVAHWEMYEYFSLRLLEVVRLYQPGAPPGRLTDQPVYYSVLTSMHALAWTDMSFFSVRSRHGDPSLPYPDKLIPRWLIAATLIAGLFPTVLAAAGALSTLQRKSLRVCTLMTVLTATSYTVWFAGQDIWALKTKYVLYLLPAYVAYMVIGLRVVRSWRPSLLPNTLLLGLLVLAVVTHLFLYAFAVS